MDDGSLSPDTILPTTSMDSDFVNELLLDGCWVGTTDGDEYNSLLSPPTTSVPLVNSLNGLPNFKAHDNGADSVPDKDTRVGTETSNPPRKQSLRYSPLEDLAGAQTQGWGAIQKSASPGKNESYSVDINESNKRIWIEPKSNTGTSPSVRERLMSAIRFLFESTRDRNILIQIWVPVKSGNKQVLITKDQPYSHDPDCASLALYRNVSKRYQFPAEENSLLSAGLPGRVFLGKVPEWTPDVRCFNQEEYPRIAFAHQLNVQGSLALPVFEQGSGSCLGVVEIVTTCQKINYRPELETICKALEAFQLRSSEITGLQNSKILNHSYVAASPQINEFLAYTCEAHNLPLAQAWAPCIQHSKGIGENTIRCMSTVDAAYYVGDHKFIGFHEECCEQHLLGDQGIVGKAFTTNQLCFSSDITTYSKTEYPLSHHAILFGLRAAVALRVRSIFTGSADFVLEYFLPVSCESFEDQERVIGSLLSFLQDCQSLYNVTDKDLQEESSVLPESIHENYNENRNSKSNPLKKAHEEDSSWIADMMGVQNKGKGISISQDITKEEPHEEFKMTTSWDDTEDESHHESVYEDLGLLQPESKDAKVISGASSFGGNRPSGSRKSGEKRRTKKEKTISLQILQHYFAGSLKDAAKSLGVCPTTLKRICRQHNISRWPSRKIKKVGHSLRKLQLVMDSVKGADGSIQISSFYSKFPELGSPNVSGASSSVPRLTDQKTQLIPQQEEASLKPLSLTRINDIQINHHHESSLISPVGTTSKSPSSSSSQISTSSLCYSTEAKADPLVVNTVSGLDAIFGESSDSAIRRISSEAELLQPPSHHVTKLPGRSQSHKLLPDLTPEMLHPLPKITGRVLQDNGAFRLKVTFGEVKVRFTLQHNWAFANLQQEIAKRFNIDDISKLHLKYLDDDSEWVLLTCDADLDECLDIYKATHSRTIKLCVLHAPHTNLGTSFGSSGLS